jgi:hypothetical protein
MNPWTMEKLAAQRVAANQADRRHHAAAPRRHRHAAVAAVPSTGRTRLGHILADAGNRIAEADRRQIFRV